MLQEAMAKIIRADFETSAADPGGWPDDAPSSTTDGGTVPEIAFVGRSNVGKSSLLNVLAERRGLARTSRDPGRTRLVNFFRVEIDEKGSRFEMRFVDLPGFGYAKVSKTERATWRPAIEKYLEQRRSLAGVVLLVDARRIPSNKEEETDALIDERELLPWIASRGVKVVPVITKADKLAKHERAIAADRLKRLIGATPLLFSALSGEGRDRLLDRLIAVVGQGGDRGLTDAKRGE